MKSTPEIYHPKCHNTTEAFFHVRVQLEKVTLVLFWFTLFMSTPMNRSTFQLFLRSIFAETQQKFYPTANTEITFCM